MSINRPASNTHTHRVFNRLGMQDLRNISVKRCKEVKAGEEMEEEEEEGEGGKGGVGVGGIAGIRAETDEM